MPRLPAAPGSSFAGFCTRRVSLCRGEPVPAVVLAKGATANNIAERLHMSEYSFFAPSSHFVHQDEGDYADFNAVPERHERTGTFWGWMAPVLGVEPERYPRPDPIVAELDAVVRRDARIAVANGRPTVRELVGEAVDLVVDVVKTKTEQAREWLSAALQHGPVDAKTIESEGHKAGFTLKMLKQLKSKMRIASVRKGRKHWVWTLPLAKAPKGAGE